MEDLTQEQEDAIILKELGIADEDSTINEETEVEVGENESTEESTVEEEAETESEAIDEEEVEEDAETEKKPKNKFAKLLSERNKARKEAELEAEEKAKALDKVSELNEKLKAFEGEGDNTSKEYIDTLVEKRMAEQNAVTDFFEEYDELKGYKKDILDTMNELSIPLEVATKVYLAEHNPSMLLSPQAKAKQKSKMLNTPTRTSQKLTKGEYEYSDAEFEAMAAAGKIKF